MTYTARRFILSVLCGFAGVETIRSAAAQTSQQPATTVDVPLVIPYKHALDLVKWNADFSGSDRKAMTVVLDLGALSPLEVVENVTITVSLYRKGKLVKTSRLNLSSPLDPQMRGGAKYAKEIPLTVRCDSIKPIRLDGRVEPLVVADEMDRPYHYPPA
jgi:hypothetical protein